MAKKKEVAEQKEAAVAVPKAKKAAPKEAAPKEAAPKEVAAPVVSDKTAPAEAKPSTKSVKIGKLPPKNKSRLPRRQKKARQKAAGRL